jgi:hypothetical protein
VSSFLNLQGIKSTITLNVKPKGKNRIHTRKWNKMNLEKVVISEDSMRGIESDEISFNYLCAFLFPTPASFI